MVGSNIDKTLLLQRIFQINASKRRCEMDTSVVRVSFTIESKDGTVPHETHLVYRGMDEQQTVMFEKTLIDWLGVLNQAAQDLLGMTKKK